MPFYKHRNFPVFLCVITLFCFHLGTLIHYPGPTPDEPWNGSRALALVEKGYPFGSLDEGYRIDVARPWAVFSLPPLLLYAIPISLTGEVGLFGLRLVSLFAGLVLLFAMMRIGAVHLGRRGMLAAAIVTGFSQVFFFCAHVARPDVMAAALVFSALSLVTGRKSRRYPFVAGLLAGLALSFQLRSLTALPIIGFYLLVVRGRSIFQHRDLLRLAAGYSAGAAVYVLLHIAPDPESFTQSWAVNVGTNRTPPLVDGALQVVWASLRSLWFGRTGLSPVGVYLPVAGLAYGILYGSRRVRKLVFASLLGFLGGVFIIRDPLIINLIALSPLLDLLTLPLVAEIFARRYRHPLRHFAWSLIAVGLVLYNLHTGLVGPAQYWWDAYQEREEVQAALASHLRPQDKIIGTPLYWLGVQKSNYLSWEGLIATKQTRNTDLEGAFQILQPDVFILDKHIRPFVRDVPMNSTWFNYLRISKSELDQVFRNHAKIIARYDTPQFGVVEVYRFNWNREVDPAAR